MCKIKVIARCTVESIHDDQFTVEFIAYKRITCEKSSAHSVPATITPELASGLQKAN